MTVTVIATGERGRTCVRHGLRIDRTEGVWHHQHTWQECAPSAGPRHGRYDWNDLKPVQAAAMLAAMIAASADTTSPKPGRHCTVGALHVQMHASFGARTWSWRTIDDALLSLTRRGAIRLHNQQGDRLDWWAVPRLLDTDRVYVDAWPVPGGAPW